MPRYYLHLVGVSDVLLDPEGIVASADNLAGIALRAARDCMASDLQVGTIDLGYSIEIYDEYGRNLHSLDFLDAINIKNGL